MSGKTSSERNTDIEFPEILYELWRQFRDMHNARGMGMGGPESITYLEIHAYSQLKNIRFEDWQLEAIRYLDNAFLASQSEK